MVPALKRALAFCNILDAKGNLSLTNLIVVNFVIALTYRMYVFESVGAGEVVAAIGAIANYGWKNARLAKEAKDWLER